MDPEKVAQLIRHAMAEGDHVTARALMENLDFWIKQGGFRPEDYEILYADFVEFWAYIEFWLTSS